VEDEEEKEKENQNINDQELICGNENQQIVILHHSFIYLGKSG